MAQENPQTSRREWMIQVASPAAFAAGRRPNILWIIGENMGPDLSCYGHSQVRSPNLDRLASEGVRYDRAFATSPVCSSSRSAFMTGMYQTAIGAHNHRSHRRDHYELPDGVLPITQRLRGAGYFAANIEFMNGKPIGTGKTDLNFAVQGEEIWTKNRQTTDDALQRHNLSNTYRLFHSNEWADLAQNKPFFAQVNLPVVELGGGRGWTGSSRNPWHGQAHPRRIDPSAVDIPPYYPDHPVVREDWAGYLDAVCDVDTRCGEILRRLEADGLLDETVVIYFGDNGRLELRGLDWCYDSGDRVPMIIRWPRSFPAPPQYRPGRVMENVVSLLDVTATTLAIAGVSRPESMHSQVLLGEDADPPRRYVFSARDRCDEAVNRIRSVRSRRYRYIRNFMPEKPYLALHRYKEACYPVIGLMRQLHREGKLDPVQEALMVSRLPDEEFYDLDNDRYEIHNLADSPRPEHRQAMRALRSALFRWLDETDDCGRILEPPEVVAFWREQQHAQHGTPAWAREGAP